MEQFTKLHQNQRGRYVIIATKEKDFGPVKCPTWLSRSYKRAVEFHCEQCREVFEEKDLEIHRIKQGYNGGTYRPGNIKVVCNPCHKDFAESW